MNDLDVIQVPRYVSPYSPQARELLRDRLGRIASIGHRIRELNPLGLNPPPLTKRHVAERYAIERTRILALPPTPTCHDCYHKGGGSCQSCDPIGNPRKIQ